jgi:uncharacterized phage protein gp47/JayE
MSTPYEYVESTGVIVPDVSDIQTQVNGEWQNVFGADLVVTADTPQGTMITAEVTARSRVAQMLAQLANMINPNLAGGVFLDAICAFLGLEREEATYTVVPAVTIAGQPNTIFQAGQLQAQGATSSAFFTNVAAVQLSVTGSATVDFQCQTAGPVECPIGDLSIATQVLGWETIDNTAAGVLGELEQSDISLRSLRKQTLALQGASTVEAITSAIADVAGVQSFSFLENIANTAETINGIPLVANSIWACVNGGASTDIAAALLKSKTIGANYNGAQSVSVVEPASGQTYTVLFDRPTQMSVMVRVTMRQGTSTADLSTAVPQAIVDYANGNVAGDAGFVVGQQVSPFDLSGAIYSEVPGAFVSKVEVAFAGASPVYQTTELAIALNQIATVTANLVQVIIITTGAP